MEKGRITHIHSSCVAQLLKLYEEHATAIPDSVAYLHNAGALHVEIDDCTYICDGHGEPRLVTTR